MSSQTIRIDGLRFLIVPPMRKHKKYSVLLYDSDSKDYQYLLSFGDSRYDQWKDSTALKLWSKYDHRDDTRKMRYYQRHGNTDDVFSAKYWSNRFLW